MMSSKYYFLLGGHDLEMSTIKKLLEEHNMSHCDKGLNWSDASWKSYADTIEEQRKKDDYIFVGIELKDKDKKPANAIDIDHHNAERCKPSSLEQVAELLEIKLTDFQKLVAINDKSYLDGLIKSNTSTEKIEEIRKKERDILGVTETDWEKAGDSVNNHLSKQGNLWVIEAQTPKFAAISDYLWLEHCQIHTDNKRKDCPEAVIIYNDNNLVYSGILFPEIINKYNELIKEKKVYYGGQGEQGYFGFTEDALKEKSVHEIIIEIEKNVQNKPAKQNNEMCSYHIFLFPFRWKNILDNEKKNSFKEKYNLDTFENNLVKDERWVRQPYKIINGSTYNEYNYFFDFVREILYDLDNELKTETTKNNDKVIRHYEYKPADINNAEIPLLYNIQYKDLIYSLEIDSILLNMYGTGVGVLSFHLRNRNHPDAIDILNINKFGRRLYPPYFSLDNSGVYTGVEKTKHSDWLKHVYNNELPEAIWISQDNNTIGIEDWHEYLCDDKFKNGPFRLPAFIKGLFPKKLFSTHEKVHKKDNRYKTYLRPALDDRMFVVSWYENEVMVKKLMTIDKEKYHFVNNDFWHNYIFIDTTYRTYQNKLKLPELLWQHTYSRWVDEGTLYGMSRYSLVMLTGKDAPAFLIRHLQTMYYKVAELALLQRTSVISFSDEVTHVSDLIHNDGKQDDKTIMEIEELYKNYLLFINKIYFREITAQEQGIEMYDMMHRTMRIPEQVKDLDNEISELNQMAQMLSEKAEQKEMKIHTILATIFLPAMFFSGILGMNILTNGDETGNNEKFHSLTDFIRGNYMLLEFVVITLILTFVIWIYTKLDKKAKIGFYILLFFLSIIICLFLTKIYLS